MTPDPNERRPTPLALKLADRIRREGPISLADYMGACLQDSEHGYYRRPASVGHDFTTAPEISQVFGELIGLWAAVVWQQMGAPSAVQLVELGPGRGTLMQDALRAARAVPEFLAAAHVRLVETSASLIDVQRAALGRINLDKTWHDSLQEVPAGPAIIMGNEFLDALPVAQFVREDEGWAEVVVGLDDKGELQLSRSVTAAKIVVTRLEDGWPSQAPGALVELNASIAKVAELIGYRSHAAPVAALFVDYGHTGSSPGDTLQAVRGHRMEHVLTSPGEADLTAHVDFEQLSRACGSRGLEVDGPVTQAEFLGALGAAERAARLMAANPVKANAIETGVQRLMSPGAMGTRVKAIGVRSPHLPPLPGLSSAPPAASIKLQPNARVT